MMNRVLHFQELMDVLTEDDAYSLAGYLISREIPTVSRLLKEATIKSIVSKVDFQPSYWKLISQLASTRLGIPVSTRSARWYAVEKDVRRNKNTTQPL